MKDFTGQLNNVDQMVVMDIIHSFNTYMPAGGTPTHRSENDKPDFYIMITASIHSSIHLSIYPSIHL